MISPSLNELAEKRLLQQYESWKNGKPQAYVQRPLPPQTADLFRENGFLVLENGLSQAEVEQLRAETVRICRGSLGEAPGLERASDAETDDDVMEKYLCIHFPHKISQVMTGTLAHPAIVDVLTRIIGPNVKCMQSMLFIKSSGKPGQAWHQDEIYIPTRDRSLTGAWIALDDATVENGCLWVIPGSQKRGLLYFQEWHGDPRFDCALEARGFPYRNEDAIPVEVKAGSVVFFNGYLLHRSLPNYAESGYRRALVNHYMSAESLLPWFADAKEIQAGGISATDVRDVTIVAGEDPYAWRGYTEIHKPHVRPSGKGGCGNNRYNTQAENAPELHEDD